MGWYVTLFGNDCEKIVEDSNSCCDDVHVTLASIGADVREMESALAIDNARHTVKGTKPIAFFILHLIASGSRETGVSPCWRSRKSAIRCR